MGRRITVVCPCPAEFSTRPPKPNRLLARDALGNIVALGNGPGANPTTETYSYDSLYRLTGITDNGTALKSYGPCSLQNISPAVCFNPG